MPTHEEYRLKIGSDLDPGRTTEGNFLTRRGTTPSPISNPPPSGRTPSPSAQLPCNHSTPGGRLRRLRIGILDLVTKSPNPSLYGRVMNPNLASIMPQAVGVWCRQAGHEVRFVCYTGLEDLLAELPADLDLLFIGAFTQSAQLSYALSNLFRSRGAVTVLGGPHARCYPEDAVKYFDYVVGFTDKTSHQGHPVRTAPSTDRSAAF